MTVHLRRSERHAPDKFERFAPTDFEFTLSAKLPSEDTMANEVLLTVEDAAARLKISKHTLNRWRVTGEGPPYIKYGPRLVRYTLSALDAWADARQFCSTSEYVRRA